MSTTQKTLSDISAKLRRVRTLKGLTQAEIAEVLGITQAAWSALERGNRKPSLDLLQRIFVEFDLSADWLLLDAGKMRPGNGRRDQADADRASAYIPVVGSIAAGMLIEHYVSEHAEEFISIRGSSSEISGEALFGLRVKGRSMEPWMYEGDIAVCSATQDVQVGQDVCVYRFETGQSTVKRLDELDRKTGLIKLRALNPMHASLSFKLKDKDQVKKVVGVWREVSTGRQYENFN